MQAITSHRTHNPTSRKHTTITNELHSTPSTPQPAHSLKRSQLLKSTLLATPLLFSQSQPAIAAETTTTIANVPASTVANVELDTISKVVLKTLSDCDLAVGIYPKFSYNADGYGGTGTAKRRSDGKIDVAWDATSLNIPPISYASTRILGLPLPPPLQIKIVPEQLVGTVDPATGEADLEFLARFEFSVGKLYEAAPLIVSTTLTTETSNGVLLSGTGRRLAADGTVRLAGVARVPKTGTDAFLDTFLQLPTDALAVLSAELKFI